MLLKLCPTLIILVLTIHSSVSLYEDQVGKFDWKKKFIGKVKFSQVDIKSKAKRAYVATESNVVAALSLKTGEIVWRQVLEAGEQGSIHLLYLGPELVTLSGNGPYFVRGWHPATGVLAFEWALPTVDRLSNTEWDIDAAKVYQVRYFAGSVEVTVFNLRTGAVAPGAGANTITATWLTPTSKCTLCGGGTMACITGNKLSVLRLGESGGGGAKTQTLSWEAVSVARLPAPAPAVVLEMRDGLRRVVLLDPALDAPLIVEAPPLPLASIALATLNNNYLLITVQRTNTLYEVSGKVVETGRVVPELSGLVRHSHPLPTAAITSAACTQDPRPSCYALVTGTDHSAILINQERVVWAREEALAKIVTVEMIDLPISDNEAAIEKEFASKEAVDLGLTSGMLGMFVRRVKSQLGQGQTLLAALLNMQDEGGHSSWSDMVKDAFGLHKLIIAVTLPSKVFGIDNESGEIVWQQSVEGVEPFEVLGNPRVPLYVQRTTRVLPHPAQCTLLFRDKVTKNTVLYVFNPINGQLLDGVVNVGYKVVQATLLPIPNTDFIKGLVLLSSDSRVGVYPESTEEQVLRSASDLFMYTVEPATGILKGYTLAYSTLRALKATLIWSLKLSGGIVSVVGKNPQEKVHSQGRVLGDRSVLYKYINPNLVTVATLSQDPVHKSVLSVFLVDTVSGHIVFSVVHKRASEPIHIVHSENWVVYSYLSDKARRTEMVALDLYEGKTQTNTTAFSSIQQRVEPFVERQAYIFAHHITAMRETITEKGITSKHILVGLGSGRVMEVPWALLDPRRPITATPEMREEGVIPYMPELALPPEAIITYNHTLPAVEAIHTSPSGLESTCLVFIYGLDLFYIRVAPSKTFDVLKDDFEYWLISAVLLGLSAAAYITKKLSSRKALKQAWK